MNLKFGEIISKKRSDKGLTQEELATELFVTRQTISRWERGHSYPTIDTLVTLSQLLDFSLDYALLGDEEMVVKVSKEQKNARKNKRIVSFIGIFIILAICWGLINVFQLNYRTAPAESVPDLEFIETDRLLITVYDPGFWSSKSVMLYEEDGQPVLEVNQQFRLTNIFQNKYQIFVLGTGKELLDGKEAIQLEGTEKRFSIPKK